MQSRPDIAKGLMRRIPEDQRHLYWVTRDHVVMKISRMADSHVLNCISFLERNAPSYLRHTIERLHNFTLFFDDPVQTPLMEEGIQLLERMNPIEFLARTKPQYQEFLREAESRGLMSPQEMYSDPAADAEILRLAQTALLPSP